MPSSISPQKIKLGYFIYGKGLGGNGRYVLNIIERLDRERYEIIVYVYCPLCADCTQFSEKLIQLRVRVQRMNEEGLPEQSPNLKPEIQNSNKIKVSQEPKTASGLKFMTDLKVSWYYLKLMGRIRVFFESQKLDVLHISLGGFPSLLHVAVAAMEAGIPKVIMIVHIMEPERPLKWIEKYFINKIVIGKITLIALSQKMKQELVARFRFAEKRIHPIYNGVDTQFYTPEKIDLSTYNGLKIESGKKIVLIPARLAFVKGHEWLFSAIAQEKKRFAGTLFLLAGEGPDRNWIEDRVKFYGLESQVRFLGFRKDLKQLMQGSDLVALSSQNEGFPFVLLEAMACEKPVVTTRAGAVEEMIESGKTGTIVPLEDSKALGQALLELLEASSEERMRIGKAGRLRVLNSFSLEQMVEKTAALYD